MNNFHQHYSFISLQLSGLIGVSYPSAEMQLVYSTLSADRAGWDIAMEVYKLVH